MIPAWVVAVLWCGAVSTQATPPGNDDFQAAYTVTGLPVSAEGGNQEATRQPGEPNDADGHGRASLWWRWTAPSSGWIEVNTLESDYDTTLSVYSGGALKGLTLLKYNDDALETKRSRVRFSAVAGTEYHIQVQSWFHAPGAARLRIQAASAPQPPTLQKVTLTPDSFVSKDLFDYVTVTVEAEITAPDGLGKAVLFMQGPQGQWWEMADLLRLESKPVPEKPFSRVYESEFYITHSYTGNGKSFFLGEWRARVVLTDDFGEIFGFGGPGEPPLPGESPPVLKISGNDDVEAAVVTSVKVTPDVIDVTDQPQSVTLEMTAKDDVSVNYVEFHLRNPQGHSVASGFSGDAPVSGTLKNGIWRLTMDIPAHLSAGSYLFDCFATDTVMRGQPATAPTIERTLTVVNKGVVDSIAPEIRAVSVSPSRISMDDLPVNVHVRIEVSDVGGCNSGWASFRPAPANPSMGYSNLSKVSRTGNIEIWESTIELSREALPGVYPMQYSLIDKAGNRVFISNDGGRAVQGPRTPVPAGVPAVFTLTPGSEDAFSVWRAKYAQLAGPQGEFDADADGDGFINAVEFLCGTDPLLKSGPDKPDPQGDRLPVFQVTPAGIRLEYCLSAGNIAGGEGTYWQLSPHFLRPSVLPYWYPWESTRVTKDFFRAELSPNESKGFMQLMLKTNFFKTYAN